MSKEPIRRGPSLPFRDIARWAVRILGVLCLLILIMVPVYTVVRPVSTLMLYEWVTGSVERDWVPFQAIAPVLVASVVMSEDGRFCSHSGVDWTEMNKVLDDTEGRPRGASTITMQTVKNLFLWTSRSYIRKAIEIPLALYANAIWSKRRTMEIYLNVVEWGPGIFGVEAASRHYFNRPAKALTVTEAALLAVTLPNPDVRNPVRPSRRMRTLASVVAGRAAQAGDYIGCLYK